MGMGVRRRGTSGTRKIWRTEANRQKVDGLFDHRGISATVEPGDSSTAFLSYVGPKARDAYLAYKSAFAATSGLDGDGPRSVEEALKSINHEDWVKAMTAEIANIERKGTWEDKHLNGRTPSDWLKMGFHAEARSRWRNP